MLQPAENHNLARRLRTLSERATGLARRHPSTVKIVDQFRAHPLLKKKKKQKKREVVPRSF